MPQLFPTQDPFETLYQRIASLERKITKLERNAIPTVPIYDWDHPPDDPVEGQHAIFINAPASGSSGLAFYRDNTHSVGAGFSDVTNWSYVAGAALLTLTDPQAPIVKESGIYGVTASMLTFDPQDGKVGNITLDGNSAAGIDLFAQQSFPLDDVPGSTPCGTATFVGYLAKDDTLDVLLSHTHDSDLVFGIFITVQLIS